MTLVEHWPNGNIKSVESRNEDGKRHNSSGPAYQWWYKDGQAYAREYWVDGKVHNLGGPAYQTWHENGQERSRCYWVEGNPLTEDAFKALQNSVEVTCGGKTVIKHWPNGRIRWIEMRNDAGKLHNPNGPAMQKWYENGQEEYRCYYVDGKRQNPNGPAHQGWRKDGQEQYRAYWVDNKLHNPDGLAVQRWYEDGRACSREYWVDDKELTGLEFKEFQNSVEVMYEGRTARISKTQAIKLGLID